MDHFLEESIGRGKRGIYDVLYAASWVVIVLSAAIALLGLQNTLAVIGSGSFDWIAPLMFLVFGAIAFLLWRMKDDFKIEYDYTFTNGILDVAKVSNNQKRKYLTALDIKSVEAAGAVNTPDFQRYVTMPGVEKHNWFLHRDAKLYYYYFTKNAKKHLMIVELSDTMVALTKKPNYMAHGVWHG